MGTHVLLIQEIREGIILKKQFTIIATVLSLFLVTSTRAQNKAAFAQSPCSVEDSNCQRAVVIFGPEISGYASIRDFKAKVFKVKLAFHTGAGKDRVEYRQVTEVNAGKRTSKWEKSSTKDCTNLGQSTRCPRDWEPSSAPDGAGDLYKAHLDILKRLEVEDKFFKGIAISD